MVPFYSRLESIYETSFPAPVIPVLTGRTPRGPQDTMTVARSRRVVVECEFTNYNFHLVTLSSDAAVNCLGSVLSVAQRSICDPEDPQYQFSSGQGSTRHPQPTLVSLRKTATEVSKISRDLAGVAPRRVGIEHGKTTR